MPGLELDIKPADFVTIGTVGPKGRRVFYLQAGQGTQIVSLVIEKEQSWALSEAIKELIDDLDTRLEEDSNANVPAESMDLREPIEPMFRVSQMGLGYEEDQDKIVLVAQELVGQGTQEEDADILGSTPGEVKPSIVRIWCSREQMRALSNHAMQKVRSGRADPKQNGRLVYYWT